MKKKLMIMGMIAGGLVTNITCAYLATWLFVMLYVGWAILVLFLCAGVAAMEYLKEQCREKLGIGTFGFVVYTEVPAFVISIAVYAYVNYLDSAGHWTGLLGGAGYLMIAFCSVLCATVFLGGTTIVSAGKSIRNKRKQKATAAVSTGSGKYASDKQGKEDILNEKYID